MVTTNKEMINRTNSSRNLIPKPAKKINRSASKSNQKINKINEVNISTKIQDLSPKKLRRVTSIGSRQDFGSGIGKSMNFYLKQNYSWPCYSSNQFKRRKEEKQANHGNQKFKIQISKID